jgi:hypothetical protein
MLMRRWEWARQGDGQLVLIVGELGKSRLIEEFHGRLGSTPRVAYNDIRPRNSLGRGRSLMHGVAPQMCRSSSPSIVRRRSQGLT